MAKRRKKPSWEEMVSELQLYINREKNCFVPASHPTLGTWVKYQRVLYHQNKIEPDRFEILDGMGFVWRVRKERRKFKKAQQTLEPVEAEAKTEGGAEAPREEEEEGTTTPREELESSSTNTTMEGHPSAFPMPGTLEKTMKYERLGTASKEWQLPDIGTTGINAAPTWTEAADAWEKADNRKGELPNAKATSMNSISATAGVEATTAPTAPTTQAPTLTTAHEEGERPSTVSRKSCQTLLCPLPKDPSEGKYSRKRKEGGLVKIYKAKLSEKQQKDSIKKGMKAIHKLNKNKLKPLPMNERLNKEQLEKLYTINLEDRKMDLVPEQLILLVNEEGDSNQTRMAQAFRLQEKIKIKNGTDHKPPKQYKKVREFYKDECQTYFVNKKDVSLLKAISMQNVKAMSMQNLSNLYKAVAVLLPNEYLPSFQQVQNNFKNCEHWWPKKPRIIILAESPIRVEEGNFEMSTEVAEKIGYDGPRSHSGMLYSLTYGEEAAFEKGKAPMTGNGGTNDFWRMFARFTLGKKYEKLFERTSVNELIPRMLIKLLILRLAMQKGIYLMDATPLPIYDNDAIERFIFGENGQVQRRRYKPLYIDVIRLSWDLFTGPYLKSKMEDVVRVIPIGASWFKAVTREKVVAVVGEEKLCEPVCHPNAWITGKGGFWREGGEGDKLCQMVEDALIPK